MENTVRGRTALAFGRHYPDPHRRRDLRRQSRPDRDHSTFNTALLRYSRHREPELERYIAKSVDAKESLSVAPTSAADCIATRYRVPWRASPRI